MLTAGSIVGKQKLPPLDKSCPLATSKGAAFFPVLLRLSHGTVQTIGSIGTCRPRDETHSRLSRL